ncbi:MAG: arsenate reductase ArsC [Homoserinimonas sp.]
MADTPRTVGRPLDSRAARDRALQVSALSDPTRLRVLSAIAADPDSSGTPASIALALAIDAEVVGASLNELASVGLVSSTLRGSTLTADAWARFGRLITATTTSPADPAPTVGTEPGHPELASLPVLERITDELAYRFSTSFSRETVARYVTESYALLAERAQITRFLPSLTSRFAADRLGALATSEGLVFRSTPEVLFVCVQNAGRSQMAAAILRHLAGDRVHVRTAGSLPAAAVHPTVVDALNEIGVPLTSGFPKPLTDEVVRAADYVITMGCGDACPIYPGRRYMDWELDDPVGGSMDEVRKIRDEVYARVRSLISEMSL